MSDPTRLEGLGRQSAELFGTSLPIVLGPMSGGPSTPELVAEVSNAGGLGSFGGGYLAPDRLRRDIRSIREKTERTFAVNLFAPAVIQPDPPAIERAMEALASYRRELGLPAGTVPNRYAEDFDDQLSVVIEEGVPIFTVTFGLLPTEAVRALGKAGVLVGVTATTVAEAQAPRTATTTTGATPLPS